MCHGLCEIGATDFRTGMTEVADWLQAHPDEVVSLMIEDHAPADQIGAVLEEAGIGPLAFVPPPAGATWPSLGQLIDSGHRVLVMLEGSDGGTRYPWLVNAYQRLVQETPYTFPRSTDFSCAPGRGRSDAPLFLVNHWLSGFDKLVTAARQVNATAMLGARVTACRQQRRLPNLVAVNYADIGDVVSVVRQLNGVGG
jgi:hypothetical protein